MNLQQKNFLDDFSELLRRYSIDSVQCDGENIAFYSNFEALRITRFNMVSGSPKFIGVTADYRPEHEKCKLFEESELNDD